MNVEAGEKPANSGGFFSVLKEIVSKPFASMPKDNEAIR